MFLGRASLLLHLGMRSVLLIRRITRPPFTPYTADISNTGDSALIRVNNEAEKALIEDLNNRGLLANSNARPSLI
ncbi:hypothetical protein D3C84_1061780 [compost metagenome]